MISPFISRLSRHCLKKPAALRNFGGGARFLSKTPLCYVVGAEYCGSTSKDGDIGKLVICNFSATSCGTKFIQRGPGPKKEFNIAPGCGKEVLEKTVPMDLMKENGTIGASHGWIATLKDGVIRLQDDLNPSASDSEPKRISLPPLVTLPHCQTQLVTNIAMSSSSPEDDEDYISHNLRFISDLKLDQTDWEWLNPCHRHEFLVESPTGETFMVK